MRFYVSWDTAFVTSPTTICQLADSPRRTHVASLRQLSKMEFRLAVRGLQKSDYKENDVLATADAVKHIDALFDKIDEVCKHALAQACRPQASLSPCTSPTN